MMSLEARSIVYDNLRQVIDLKVDMSQTGLVSSNSRTIAQAHYEPHSWLRGLWHNNQAVGLIAMVDMLPDHPEADERDPHNAAYLWRLMIDSRFQRQGFGSKAMEIAFSQARKWGRSKICNHISTTDGNAKDFYEKFGLHLTDRVDEGEAFMVGLVP